MTNDRTRARPGWLLLPSSTAARSCVCCAGCGAVDRRPLCRYAATPFCHYADLPLRRKVRSVWSTHVCAHHPAQTGCAVHRPSDGLCCAQAVWPPHEHCERQRMCACACRRLALAPRRAAARVSACRADVDGAVLSPGASRCRCGVRRDERRRRNVGASGSGTSSRGQSGGHSGGRGSGGSGETRQRPPRCERSGVRRL